MDLMWDAITENPVYAAVVTLLLCFLAMAGAWLSWRAAKEDERNRSQRR